MKNSSFTSCLHAFFYACIFLFSAQIVSAQYDNQSYELLKSNPEAFRTKLLENPDFVLNFKGADLRGMDLSRMRLIGADLSYSQLEGVSLKESDLTNVSLIGAKIMKTDFSRANLSYTNFNKSNATGAIFKDAIFKNTVTEYLLIQVGHQLNPAYITSEGIVSPITK